MKLQPMSDFVLEQSEILKKYINHDKAALFEKCKNYANFLKQSLYLGMFVPVGEDGNVFKKPELNNGYAHETSQLITKYYQAKKTVLFEGFEFFEIKEGEVSGYVKNKKLDVVFSFPNNREYTIEDLCQCNVELTTSALKTIELYQK